MVRFFSGVAAFIFPVAVLGLAFPTADDLGLSLEPRQSVCENAASSRSCWSDGFDINTDFYTDAPDTGVTREYWLSIESAPCAPDGVQRTCQTFNGTVPGPLLTADWGDTLTVHVTNNLVDNGTTIHWHGIRQLNSSWMDGVPGVTQCPIAPGDTMTYSFKLTQYGTTWYHSHFTLQYAEGLFGPLTINGPASADYDEDLGTMFLQDWSHTPAFELWGRAPGTVFTLDNTLLNGTNTFNSTDGTITGSKYEMVVESGKKYRVRLINVAIDGVFDFHIDGHNFTVISTDLVPIVPFETENVQIHIGQRYDIIIEANATPGDYWIRGGWNVNCANIGQNGDVSGDSTGILRYDASSTSNPTTTDTVGVLDLCYDQNATTLVPVVGIDVTDTDLEIVTETLSFSTSIKNYFTWTLNASTLYLDWDEPTLKQVHDNITTYDAEENVVSVGQGFELDQWVVLVIDASASGIPLSHPIHLHGHDFFVLAQEPNLQFDGTTDTFNLVNPPRRDVAVLPSKGYLALAFQLDNPGAWIVHCHIAWHASEGLAMQFVESPGEIVTSGALGGWDTTEDNGADTCTNWATYNASPVHEQDDSGI
ncbi:laccase precursor [Pestalotiopsis sp. NC0098]|nr:laccase precursor [Pestalotiopsis sp. NC0098]